MTAAGPSQTYLTARFTARCAFPPSSRKTPTRLSSEGTSAAATPSHGDSLGDAPSGRAAASVRRWEPCTVKRGWRAGPPFGEETMSGERLTQMATRTYPVPLRSDRSSSQGASEPSIFSSTRHVLVSMWPAGQLSPGGRARCCFAPTWVSLTQS